MQSSKILRGLLRHGPGINVPQPSDVNPVIVVAIGCGAWWALEGRVAISMEEIEHGINMPCPATHQHHHGQGKMAGCGA
jgi:hypothetical protein